MLHTTQQVLTPAVRRKLSEISVVQGKQKFTLANGTAVGRQFYNELKRHVESQIPKLLHGRRYTAKMICGKAYWHSLELKRKGFRNLAGMAIKNLVVLREIGLVLVSANGKSLRYVLA